MTFYIILALSAFLISLLGTRLTILALRQRTMPIDLASLRADYVKPPLPGGGIAIVMALIISLLVAEIDYGIILSIFLLAALSLLGDLIMIPLWVRLPVQLLAAMIAMHVLPGPLFHGLLPLWLDKTVTVLAWLWFMQAFRATDGIDGLSPSIMVCIGIGVCMILAMSGNSFPNTLAVYGLIVACAGSGFLWWNWHPAKIVQGEVGAIPVGFFLGFLLLLLAVSGYPWAAMILPAYPLADAGVTWIRCLVKRRKVRYYYQRALISGRRQDAVVRYVFGVHFILIFQAVFSSLDPEQGMFYVSLAYASVFMILGFFAHTAHDPDYEPF